VGGGGRVSWPSSGGGSSKSGGGVEVPIGALLRGSPSPRILSRCHRRYESHLESLGLG
jgi:hypothetical protein